MRIEDAIRYLQSQGFEVTRQTEAEAFALIAPIAKNEEHFDQLMNDGTYSVFSPVVEETFLLTEQELVRMAVGNPPEGWPAVLWPPVENKRTGTEQIEDEFGNVQNVPKYEDVFDWGQYYKVIQDVEEPAFQGWAAEEAKRRAMRRGWVTGKTYETYVSGYTPDGDELFLYREVEEERPEEEEFQGYPTRAEAEAHPTFDPETEEVVRGKGTLSNRFFIQGKESTEQVGKRYDTYEEAQAALPPGFRVTPITMDGGSQAWGFERIPVADTKGDRRLSVEEEIARLTLSNKPGDLERAFQLDAALDQINRQRMTEAEAFALIAPIAKNEEHFDQLWTALMGQPAGGAAGIPLSFDGGAGAAVTAADVPREVSATPPTMQAGDLQAIFGAEQEKQRRLRVLRQHEAAMIASLDPDVLEVEEEDRIRDELERVRAEIKRIGTGRLPFEDVSDAGGIKDIQGVLAAGGRVPVRSEAEFRAAVARINERMAAGELTLEEATQQIRGLREGYTPAIGPQGTAFLQAGGTPGDESEIAAWADAMGLAQRPMEVSQQTYFPEEGPDRDLYPVAGVGITQAEYDKMPDPANESEAAKKRRGLPYQTVHGFNFVPTKKVSVSGAGGGGLGRGARGAEIRAGAKPTEAEQTQDAAGRSPLGFGKPAATAPDPWKAKYKKEYIDEPEQTRFRRRGVPSLAFI